MRVVNDLATKYQKGPSCRVVGGLLIIFRGTGGLSLPRASMARPTRAAGLWNPKAIRVMTLVLVFTDSIRPFDRVVDYA